MEGTSLQVSGGVYRNVGTAAEKRKDNAETRKALDYVSIMARIGIPAGVGTSRRRPLQRQEQPCGETTLV